jgi:hypothetical protein
MNPNRLLHQNRQLVQQNSSLNTSLNNVIHQLRSVDKQLQEHKALLSSATERALLAEKKLNELGTVALDHPLLEKELVSRATERALLAEKKLTEIARSMDQQIQSQKILLDQANERANVAEKKLEPKKDKEYPSIHITRTRLH